MRLLFIVKDVFTAKQRLPRKILLVEFNLVNAVENQLARGLIVNKSIGLASVLEYFPVALHANVLERVLLFLLGTTMIFTVVVPDCPSVAAGDRTT